MSNLDVFLRKRKLPTRIKQIVGDGNCLFRALGDQMGIEHRHLEIRRNICNYMYNNPENFRKFILSDQSFEEYVYQMSLPYTWGIVIINVKLQILNQFIIFHLKQGDQLAIQAFCDIYLMNVNIVEVNAPNGLIRETLIEPRIYLNRYNFQRQINLLFDGLHYDSLQFS